MVYIPKLSAALAVACIAGSAVAHPGEVHDAAHVKRELAQRAAVASHYTRGLSKCADSIKARGVKERAVARRSAKAAELRAKRGIPESMDVKINHIHIPLSNEVLQSTSSTAVTTKPFLSTLVPSTTTRPA